MSNHMDIMMAEKHSRGTDTQTTPIAANTERPQTLAVQIQLPCFNPTNAAKWFQRAEMQSCLKKTMQQNDKLTLFLPPLQRKRSS